MFTSVEMSFLIKKYGHFTRRNVLTLGGVLLLWPLLRFLAHKVPRKPKIIEVSGSFQTKNFLNKGEFIVFNQDDKLWAISRSCTHLGCRLNFIEKENHLECPCHQSRFTIAGEVIRGPAIKPLPRYKVEPTSSPTTYLVTIT